MATPANNAAVLTNSFFLMECFLFFSLRLPPVRGPLLSVEEKTSSHRLQFQIAHRKCCGTAARFPVIRRELNMQDDLGNSARSLSSALRIEADAIAPR